MRQLRITAKDWVDVFCCLISIVNIIFIKRKNIINRITELWLKANGVKYDKLVVEKGNEHETDPAHGEHIE